MGAGAAVVGILVVIGLVVLGFVILGAVLLIAGLAGQPNRPRRLNGVAWAGIATLATPAIAFVVLLVWVQLYGPPATVRLDLRQPISAASINSEYRGPSGFKNWGSDQVEITLPDGALFNASTDNVFAIYDDGLVNTIELGNTAPWADVNAQLEQWATGLGLTAQGLDGDPDWEQTGTVHGVHVRLVRQPLGDDEPPTKGQARLYLSEWAGN
jgi:hypothetical protein